MSNDDDEETQHTFPRHYFICISDSSPVCIATNYSGFFAHVRFNLFFLKCTSCFIRIPFYFLLSQLHPDPWRYIIITVLLAVIWQIVLSPLLSTITFLNKMHACSRLTHRRRQRPRSFLNRRRKKQEVNAFESLHCFSRKLAGIRERARHSMKLTHQNSRFTRAIGGKTKKKKKVFQWNK